MRESRKSTSESIYILGINAYHGDVSAVLLKDGQLIVAVEEERFRRIKHWAGFPTLSVRKCLEIGGITSDKISHVAISRDPKANLLKKVKYILAEKPALSHILDRVQNSRQVLKIEEPLAVALNVRITQLPTIHNVEHHPAHLASAFFVSPFANAAVCAIDGFGDFVSTSWAVGEDNSLEFLDRVYFPHSLGMLYTALTQYLGFQNYGDEYKVMGLAPYGRSTHVDQIRSLVKLKEDGMFELNLQFFRHWSDGVDMEWEKGYPVLGKVYTSALEDLLGPERQPTDEVTEFHMNIAHSIQQVYEECAFHVLLGVWERTKNPRLCLAGGCAMNSVANGKISQNTPFRDIYIQPAAADNGTALGAAYYVWHVVHNQPRCFVMDHAFWGTNYPDGSVLSHLIEFGETPNSFRWSQYESDEELCKATASLIADGNVIGWFQGRMEWGSRALGNRSILADPRQSDMRDQINTKIKLRESFRPFAPSILAEALDDYFVGASPDPFMQQVYPVQESKRSVIPATTHVDGSGRFQAVFRHTNELFHTLISEFNNITGVPVLLNTSFNENEPIVDTPEQAMECFLRTDMDAVVIGDMIIRRNRNQHDRNVAVNPVLAQ